jgi:hypothetical protein
MAKPKFTVFQVIPIRSVWFLCRGVERAALAISSFRKRRTRTAIFFYFGYFLTEDYEPGAAEKTITQCPFVMMEESVAAARYPIAEKAHDVSSFNFRYGRPRVLKGNMSRACVPNAACFGLSAAKLTLAAENFRHPEVAAKGTHRACAMGSRCGPRRATAEAAHPSRLAAAPLAPQDDG